MPDIDWCAARLRQSASLAGTLDASFDAFEAIRQLARRCEGTSPDLLAAFMSPAAEAADGRDAITSVPALPPAGTHSWPHGTPGRETDPDDAADSMAALAALLVSRLEQAEPLATTPNDRLACRDAARSARQIQQLMAPPMTPVFGEFLVLAGQQIAAATLPRGELPGDARDEIIGELDRLVTAMARYANDHVLPGAFHPAAPAEPTADEQAAHGARSGRFTDRPGGP